MTVKRIRRPPVGPRAALAAADGRARSRARRRRRAAAPRPTACTRSAGSVGASRTAPDSCCGSAGRRRSRRPRERGDGPDPQQQPPAPVQHREQCRGARRRCPTAGVAMNAPSSPTATGHRRASRGGRPAPRRAPPPLRHRSGARSAGRRPTARDGSGRAPLRRRRTSSTRHSSTPAADSGCRARPASGASTRGARRGRRALRVMYQPFAIPSTTVGLPSDVPSDSVAFQPSLWLWSSTSQNGPPGS